MKGKTYRAEHMRDRPKADETRCGKASVKKQNASLTVRPKSKSAVPPPAEEDVFPSFTIDNLDRIARGSTARVTQGVSPYAEGAARFEWVSHLLRAPGRQIELSLTAGKNVTRLILSTAE